jgi:hypothetical protein
MTIEYVSDKKIKINPNNLDYDIIPFYTSATTSSFQFKIKVQPKTILKIDSS